MSWFQAIGSQAVSGFSVGELIEITDDARELAGLPGELRRIKAIEAASTAFTLDTPLSHGLVQAGQNGVPDATRHMRVRRWHGNGAIQSPGNWIELENGIAVCFDADPTDGCFRTGDYWFIPARVANQSLAARPGAARHPSSCCKARAVHAAERAARPARAEG